MGKADGSPGEEVGETGKGQEPVEDVITLWCQVDIGQKTEGKGGNQSNVWATLLVDLSSPGWTHSLLAESLNGTGRSVRAGVGDGDDGEGDDGVKDGWENFDTGILEGQDEWRVLGIGTGGVGKVGIIRWDNETEDSKGDNVEEGDTPEDLLGSLWNGLSWVGGLSGGKTDQLGSSEGERGGDEDGAETVETVLEGSTVRTVSVVVSLPVFTTNVTSVVGWDTTAVDDDTSNDETNDSKDLHDTENELDLTVTLDTKEVDGNDQNKEDGNPDSDINLLIWIPELDCDTGGGQFEWENNQPVKGVVPTHGKSPSWVNKADRVVIERSVNRVPKKLSIKKYLWVV